jgi:N-acetyl-anhydromuramyl-L-alanine amidase AmpD
MAEYEVQQRVAPASASTPRRGSRVHLIVLHSDLGSAFESLTAFTARGSTSAPHFHIAADGTITQLVPYKRAARHSGRANWKNRIRNIELISVCVMLEHYLDGTSGAAQI